MENTKEIVKKKKISELIQTPKTCIESTKFIDFVTNKINNLYYFTIKDENITIYNKTNEIISNIDIISSNIDHENVSKIIAPFIKKYHYNFSIKFACLENEIGNPILYVFLMPFVSSDNYYIIKVGYTKNIIQRYGELKKEFDVNKIYLIYAKRINGEHIELNIHKNLKNTFSTNIYKMKKNKKIENSSISEETYKYTWILFKNILNITYRTYIMNNKITLLNKENENKMLDIKLKELENENKMLDIKLKELELENEKKLLDIKLKELENEKIKMGFENEKKLLDIKLKELENEKIKMGFENENKKMEFEIKKMEFEIKKMEFEK